MTHQLNQNNMSALSKLQQDFTQNVIGYSAIGIILSTCLGSFAVMQVLAHGNGILTMTITMLCVIMCTTYNAAILTVQKPKLIFQLLIASSIFNTLVFIIASLW